MTTGWGIIINDPLGRQLVGPDTAMGRILGSVAVAAGTTGSLTNDGFLTGTPFAIVDPTDDPSALGVFQLPKVAFSGHTMSWSTQPDPTYDGFTFTPCASLITYGVY